ncbi:group II truncated hemoglobin [Stutzerimonas stutzeri]
MTTSQAPFGVADSSFQAAGGEAGIQRLVDDFYQIMEQSSLGQSVRRLYPADLEGSRARLTAFLCGWLGGPRRYAEQYGGISIPRFHTRWQIGEVEREAWLGCMAAAIARQGYAPAFADYLLTQLRVPAARIVQANSRHCPLAAIQEPSQP